MTDSLNDPRFPDRPDTQEFWQLSEIVLQLDAAAQEFYDEAITRAMEEIGMDPSSIVYMANQRASRLTTSSTVRLLCAVSYLEAFIVGARYQARYGKDHS